MEIEFRTSKLAKQCNIHKNAVRKWGPQLADKLRRRLDDLVAAENLEDMRTAFPGRYHELKGDRAGQLSLDLEHPQRLLFEPAHDVTPLRPDGGLDRSHITKIRILAVEDTHG